MSDQFQPQSPPDATARIVNQRQQQRRQRARMPIPRTVSLMENALEQEQSSSQVGDETLSPVRSISSIPESTAHKSNKNSSSNSDQQLVSLPPELNVSKGTTIRLQADIRQQLNIDTAAKTYTIETFVEAAWLELQQHPELLEIVVAEAQRRCSVRKQYGRAKAAQTFSETFNQRGMLI